MSNPLNTILSTTWAQCSTLMPWALQQHTSALQPLAIPVHRLSNTHYGQHYRQGGFTRPMRSSFAAPTSTWRATVTHTWATLWPTDHGGTTFQARQQPFRPGALHSLQPGVLARYTGRLNWDLANVLGNAVSVAIMPTWIGGLTRLLPRAQNCQAVVAMTRAHYVPSAATKRSQQTLHGKSHQLEWPIVIVLAKMSEKGAQWALAE